jgi:hypothetical protein
MGNRVLANHEAPPEKGEDCEILYPVGPKRGNGIFVREKERRILFQYGKNPSRGADLAKKERKRRELEGGRPVAFLPGRFIVRRGKIPSRP